MTVCLFLRMSCIRANLEPHLGLQTAAIAPHLTAHAQAGHEGSGLGHL